MDFMEERDYRIDQATGCWLWLRSTNRKGYAMLGGHWWRSSGGRSVLAHRISWEDARGERIPDGWTVDHLCRTRSCINPDHLKPGPHADNVRNSSRSIVNEDQVRQIRALPEGTKTRSIADEFGLSMVQVRKIVQRAAWVDVV